MGIQKELIEQFEQVDREFDESRFPGDHVMVEVDGLEDAEFPEVTKVDNDASIVDYNETSSESESEEVIEPKQGTSRQDDDIRSVDSSVVTFRNTVVDFESL